jgi:hypothetical protein
LARRVLLAIPDRRCWLLAGPQVNSGHRWRRS